MLFCRDDIVIEINKLNGRNFKGKIANAEALRVIFVGTLGCTKEHTGKHQLWIQHGMHNHLRTG
jgi:hypothetical protein